MFNLNQNHTNFLIEPNPANGLEWQMMSYTLNNNTVLQVNITYTNVLVPGSINTLPGDKDFSAAVRCYKSKPCRMYFPSDINPLRFKWAPTYSVANHGAEGESSGTLMMFTEQVPVSYTNTGQDSFTSSYLVTPRIVFINMVVGNEIDYVSRQCTLDPSTYVDVHVCSLTQWPTFGTPAVSSKFTAGTQTFQHFANGTVYLENISINPTTKVLRWLLQQRYPRISQVEFTNSNCIDSPTMSTSASSTNVISAVSCYHNTFKGSNIFVNLMTTSANTHLSAGPPISTLSLNTNSRILSLVVTRSGTQSFINYIHNATRFGFWIKRSGLTVTDTSVSIDPAVDFSVPYNDFLFSNTTAPNNYHLCASTTSFVVIINRAKLIRGHWAWGANQTAFLHESRLLTNMDLIDSTCYSDGVNQPLLAVVGHQNGISRLLLFRTDSIGDISNVLVLNQTLPDNFQITTPQDTFLTSLIQQRSLFVSIGEFSSSIYQILSGVSKPKTPPPTLVRASASTFCLLVRAPVLAKAFHTQHSTLRSPSSLRSILPTPTMFFSISQITSQPTPRQTPTSLVYE